MRTGIWIVRPEALPLAKQLCTEIDAQIHQPESGYSSNRERFREAFSHHQRWILIMTTGIALRYIDGLPRDKRSDPAVVVMDEGGRHAISLLSGHEGGANELAYAAARVTGAQPIITTATESLKPLVIGIGCRKDVSLQQIEDAIHEAIRLSGHSREDIREVATIDLKKDEPALIQWCLNQSLPLRTITQSSIAARPWVTEKSDWVQSNIGVPGVCEPVALIAAPRGRLLVPKLSLNGVSVAIVFDPPFSS